MKKSIFLRLISIALTVVFIAIACSMTLTTVTAASTTQNKTVSFNTPAIPADVNSTVDLSSYSVELKLGTVTASNKITWSTSDSIAISSIKVTPSAKGVYKLTASDGTTSKTVYLVVKAANETEYVLYEDDFNSDTISNYKTSGTCSISGGKCITNRYYS